MNRIVSYCLALAAIIIFVLAPEVDTWRFINAFLLSLLVAYLAFFLNWVTLDSTLAITVLGTIALGFGGWMLAAALVFFFGSSSYLTNLRENSENESDGSPRSKPRTRRDAFQVWSNGFWIALFTLSWGIFYEPFLLVAAFSSLAVAAADTWATEIGTKNPGKTRNILSGKLVEPGQDGGVSKKGHAAAFLGAAAIALFIFGSFDDGVLWAFLVITGAGFAGMLADSLLGAIYLSREMKFPLFGTSLQKAANGKNNLTNWLSTGFGGLLALILHSIF